MRNFLTTPDRRVSVWDLFNEMDKAFNQSMTQTGQEESSFNPQVDIEETDSVYLISVDLPGVKKDQVKIDVNDGLLKISGTRGFEKKSGDNHYQRFEKRYGSFERSFRLPTKIDENKIQAHYEDGVLEIVVPKAELQKGRKVEIQSGKGGLFSKFLDSKDQAKKSDTPDEKH